MKKSSKILTCFLALGMSFLTGLSTGTTAFAKEIEDGPVIGDLTLLPEEDLTKVPDDGMGSITLNLTDSEDKVSKEGVQFNVIQVATIEKGLYALNDRFKETKVDLNAIQNAEELEKAANTLNAATKDNNALEKKDNNTASTENTVDSTAYEDTVITTDEDGMAQAKNLPVGVYLVSVANPASYEVVKPFIVAIPTWSDTDEIFEYNVTVEPKHSSLPRVLINKVDSTTQKNITGKDFEFTMYEDKDCTKTADVEKGNTENGTAQFMIHYGTYYIKETKAPAKYKMSDEVVKVTFNFDGLYVNDKLVETGDNFTYSYAYADTPEDDVNTGLKSNGTLYLLMGGAAIICIALLRNKKTGKISEK